MSKSTHPLILLLDRLPICACADARSWVRGLRRDTTPAEAWAMAPTDWKEWLREALRGNTDPAWMAIVTEIPDMMPRKRPAPDSDRRVRSRAPRTIDGARQRCFFARLAGTRRRVAVRCESCGGSGQWCFECSDGKIMTEALHPADAWTLKSMAAMLPHADIRV
jgi:hypothetical protein